MFTSIKNHDQQPSLYYCSKSNEVKVTTGPVPDEPDFKTATFEQLERFKNKIQHLKDTAVSVKHQHHAQWLALGRPDIKYMGKMKKDTFYKLPEGYKVVFKETCSFTGNTCDDYCKECSYDARKVATIV